MSNKITKKMIDDCLSHFSKDELNDIFEAEESEPYSIFPSNFDSRSKPSSKKEK